MEKLSAQEKIIHSAKQEFLQYGFENASLRSIATAAGMTTGAIYTYFRDKNDLFETIVDPLCAQVEDMFSNLSKSYYTRDKIVCDINYEKLIDDLYLVYEFIYKNFDIFRLLVVGANGSSRSNFIHTLVNYQEQHAKAYLDRMNLCKEVSSKMNDTVLHIISESYINALLEPVRHNLSYKKAVENLEFLVAFYTGGWLRVCSERT